MVNKSINLRQPKIEILFAEAYDKEQVLVLVQ